MTPEQFLTTSCAILRTTVGWQTKIAHRLGVEPRTVRRWIEAREIPAWAVEKLTEMIGRADADAWPRDEWLIGDARGGDGQQREYIVHLQVPRFSARIVMRDDDGDPLASEQPADVVSGTVYASENYCLCEIDWIDQPRPGEITQLMEAAADAIDGAVTA